MSRSNQINGEEVVDDSLKAALQPARDAAASSTNHGGNNVVVVPPAQAPSDDSIKVDVKGLDVETTDKTHTTPKGTKDTVVSTRVLAQAINVQVPKIAAEIAQQEIESADKQRQAKEDARSIKRNKNRMYTLFFALFCSVIITYALSTALRGTYIGTTFGPYSFAITILFDSALTVWAYWHRY